MGKVTGFMEFRREMPEKRPAGERVRDYLEVYEGFTEEKAREQGARCMDCAIPFCHSGCPLGNIIPDWNDLVFRDRWREAIERLHATNNFPEFTGRICPAPCEAACVLGINDDPVTIEMIEHAIAQQHAPVAAKRARSDEGFHRTALSPIAITAQPEKFDRQRKAHEG